MVDHYVDFSNWGGIAVGIVLVAWIVTAIAELWRRGDRR